MPYTDNSILLIASVARNRTRQLWVKKNFGPLSSTHSLRVTSPETPKRWYVAFDGVLYKTPSFVVLSSVAHGEMFEFPNEYPRPRAFASNGNLRYYLRSDFRLVQWLTRGAGVSTRDNDDDTSRRQHGARMQGSPFQKASITNDS